MLEERREGGREGGGERGSGTRKFVSRKRTQINSFCTFHLFPLRNLGPGGGGGGGGPRGGYTPRPVVVSRSSTALGYIQVSLVLRCTYGGAQGGPLSTCRRVTIPLRLSGSCSMTMTHVGGGVVPWAVLREDSSVGTGAGVADTFSRNYADGGPISGRTKGFGRGCPETTDEAHVINSAAAPIV